LLTTTSPSRTVLLLADQLISRVLSCLYQQKGLAAVWPPFSEISITHVGRLISADDAIIMLEQATESQSLAISYVREEGILILGGRCLKN
jgi:hypothetical protein